jgi:NAD(P)-dependent dehydrogenase (short-subunit alcohol dehydrogenase family)
VIAVVSPGNKMSIAATGDLVVIDADLTLEKSSEELIANVVSNYKSIDVTLLLVGGYAPGSVSETDGSQLRKMYSLNFETAYFIARPAFSQMMKQPAGGRIIFIGARPALLPKDGKGSLAYALSKSLIFKLADFLNAEGEFKNVLSSVIVPSTIDTPANRKAMPEANFSSWVAPEAIAEVLSFAASSESAPLRDTVFKVYGNA